MSGIFQLADLSVLFSSRVIAAGQQALQLYWKRSQRTTLRLIPLKPERERVRQEGKRVEGKRNTFGTKQQALYNWSGEKR
jgi:hypothetical protein